MLGTKAQDRPVSHQQLQPRAAHQQVGQARRGPEHLLEVIEQQQHMPVVKVGAQ